MGSKTEISIEELAKHNTEKDAWMALNGKVYDVTTYISKHPGGKANILLGVGKDATALFKQAHAYVDPDSMLKQVGILKNSNGSRSPRLFLEV